MIRRSFRIGLWLGVLGGLTYAVRRLLGKKELPTAAGGSGGTSAPWSRLDVDPKGSTTTAAATTPAREPVTVATPAPAEAPARAPRTRPLRAGSAPSPDAPAKSTKQVLESWVDPKGDICPRTHPVKAKLSSKIFQVVGNVAYNRTKPDRCYKDPEAAEADGFRAAKR
ncbi:MAG: hypothetical protein ABIV94_03910 [Acidimicrobiales bacterium]